MCIILGFFQNLSLALFFISTFTYVSLLLRNPRNKKNLFLLNSRVIERCEVHRSKCYEAINSSFHYCLINLIFLIFIIPCYFFLLFSVALYMNSFFKTFLHSFKGSSTLCYFFIARLFLRYFSKYFFDELYEAAVVTATASFTGLTSKFLYFLCY
jgi:hypothetical protein